MRGETGADERSAGGGAAAGVMPSNGLVRVRAAVDSPAVHSTHLLVINIHELLRSRRFFCAFLQHLIRAKTGPGVGFYKGDCFCAAARTIIEISDYDDELRCLSKQLFAQYLYTQTEAPSFLDIASPR